MWRHDTIWVGIRGDFYLLTRGANNTTKSLGRLSFKPKENLDYGWGDWETEEKEDKIVMEEGAEFPYGYEPLYRDKQTGCLVMRRNRSLTTESENKARKFAMSEERWLRLRAFHRAQQRSFV
jgi:hypothetical protein